MNSVSTHTPLTLRRYQETCIERVLAVYQRQPQGSKALLVLPTGTGKTIIFGSVIHAIRQRQQDVNVLIVAHRQELLQQAADKYRLIDQVKERSIRLEEFEEAVRANRQFAVALQTQGLNEDAARFAYRAQKLQRVVLRRQKKFGQYLFALFLDLLAGYGYRPGRSLMAYLIIIFGFMGLYLLNAHFAVPHLSWDEALVLSVSSFHGRGFFSQDITLGDTYARLAALEAVIGLLIEVSLIATFTRRFFGN